MQKGEGVEVMYIPATDSNPVPLLEADAAAAASVAEEEGEGGMEVTYQVTSN